MHRGDISNWGSTTETVQELTKIKGKTALIHEGLRALISQAAREHLIALGEADKKDFGRPLTIDPDSTGP